ncbi:MAG: hypothetical protein M3N39_04260 [Pseudomonadota bacterium]|nr:hypothetical protein [Pseudomonadota bacterium]
MRGAVKEFVNECAGGDASHSGSSLGGSTKATRPVSLARSERGIAGIFGGMHRVRIGLTGLAFVFVLVLLAAIFTSPSEEQPITANMIEQQLRPGAMPLNQSASEPKEPLAELGVAPGNADSNTGAGAAPQPTTDR